MRRSISESPVALIDGQKNGQKEMNSPIVFSFLGQVPSDTFPGAKTTLPKPRRYLVTLGNATFGKSNGYCCGQKSHSLAGMQSIKPGELEGHLAPNSGGIHRIARIRPPNSRIHLLII
jgi:hypothetical protein